MATQNLASTFLACSSFAIPTSASLYQVASDKKKFSLDVTLKQRDCFEGKEKHWNQTSLLEISRENEVTTIFSSRPVVAAQPLVVSTSPSGKKSIRITEVKDDSATKQWMELWSDSQLLTTVELTDLHGKVVSQYAHVGGVSWSANEEFVAYVAEPKLDRGKSFFSSKRPTDTTPEKKGQQHIFEDDFGEIMSEVAQPRVFVIDLTDPLRICHAQNRVVEIPPPEGFGACGAPVFAPLNGVNSLLVTVYETYPRRLGLVFCQNRKSSLFVATIEKRFFDLSAENRVIPSRRVVDDELAFCGRWNQNGSKIVYLSPSSILSHRSCLRLKVVDTEILFAQAKADQPPPSARVLLDIVNEKQDNLFPGLFAEAIGTRCWTNDGNHIVMTCDWGCDTRIIKISLSAGEVTALTPAGESWSLFDVCDDVMVAQYSAPNQTPKLAVARLTNSSPLWTDVSGLSNSIVFPFSYRITSTLVPRSVGSTESDSVESVLLLPDANQHKSPAPLILFVHGGPHGVFNTTFMLGPAFLLSLGYAILMPNFRGSLGFGQRPLLSLLGKIGRQDVDDVMSTLESVTSSYSDVIDPSRVFVMGGSHGGFLGLHLIGQFPDRFKACCVRNPVSNVATMVTTSDIPDWCFAEALVSEVSDLTADATKTMFEMSPIAHVHKVTTPVLLMLGTDDRRVPPSQGLDYYQQLRRLGKAKSRLHLYKGNTHSLSKVDCESDHWLNLAALFAEYRD